LQRDMRAGHAMRAIKSAHARTHACMHARAHTQTSLVILCRRLSRGRQPSDVELGARTAVGGKSGDATEPSHALGRTGVAIAARGGTRAGCVWWATAYLVGGCACRLPFRP
jgi:hypothetical protein